MLFCFFEYWYMCVLHSIFVSEVIYFSHQNVVIVQSVWHSLLLRNNLFVLARRTTAIVLWAKLLGFEKLNKRGFKLLSRVSLYFALLSLKFSRPPRRTLPQTFLVTASVAAPAVVLCLRSLIGTLSIDNEIRRRRAEVKFSPTSFLRMCDVVKSSSSHRRRLNLGRFSVLVKT